MLVQIALPLLRAREQPKASWLTFANPPPQQPHCIRPENRNLGRRRSHTGTRVPLEISAPWRLRTACQSSSSTMRSSGTSVISHSSSGFIRLTRLPVIGSLA
ncbi:hypothetical protein A6024_03880 [Rhodovulum sulfidophilum]|nr:hypothetical protein A6W98_03895 [Rhodovulum sulfidophilum DSM 1374]ANB37135.1 hypothetical protein A6024_03880 [Rhodovulum sulfidophilum]